MPHPTAALPSYIVDRTHGNNGPCTVFYQDEQARAEGGRVQSRHATRGAAVRFIERTLAVRHDGPFTVLPRAAADVLVALLALDEESEWMDLGGDMVAKRSDDAHIVLSVPAYGGGEGDAVYSPAVQTLLAAVPVSAIIDAEVEGPGREWWLVRRAGL